MGSSAVLLSMFIDIRDPAELRVTFHFTPSVLLSDVLIMLHPLNSTAAHPRETETSFHFTNFKFHDSSVTSQFSVFGSTAWLIVLLNLLAGSPWI